MARKPQAETPSTGDERIRQLETADPVAGIAGPGRWLVNEYAPVSLFSLKPSYATSAVGKSLLLPTPYAIKMAFVDAAFRAGLHDEGCAGLLQALARGKVRVRPPEAAVVTHTFVKVRQEMKDAKKSAEPYTSSIAYREVVSHHGSTWLWAFDLALCDDATTSELVRLAPHVRYVGKRGSFVQFVGIGRRSFLDVGFTTEIDEPAAVDLPPLFHFAPLDDFGPEATLNILSSYSEAKAKRDVHRRFVRTLVPIGLVNTGPGFSEYARQRRDDNA
jgi:hypothetical protein